MTEDALNVPQAAFSARSKLFSGAHKGLRGSAPAHLSQSSSTEHRPLSRVPPNSLGSDATFSRKPAVASATPRSSPWSSLQFLGHSSTQPGSSCLSACSHSALDSSPRWKSRAVPSVKLQPRTSKPGAEETLGKSLMKNNILSHLLVCCLS